MNFSSEWNKMHSPLLDLGDRLVLSSVLVFLDVGSICNLVTASQAHRSLQDNQSLWIPLCRAFKDPKGSRRSKRQRVNAFKAFILEHKAMQHKRDRIMLQVTQFARKRTMDGAPITGVRGKLRKLMRENADNFPIDWTSRAFAHNTVLNTFAAYAPLGDDGDIRLFQDLIEKFGASVHVPDLYGMDPLMHAACHGHLTLVRYLLQKDAQPLLRGALTPGSIVSYTRLTKRPRCVHLPLSLLLTQIYR
jgi:hypothetical protein